MGRQPLPDEGGGLIAVPGQIDSWTFANHLAGGCLPKYPNGVFVLTPRGYFFNPKITPFSRSIDRRKALIFQAYKSV
jgi:hypothetical protein